MLQIVGKLKNLEAEYVGQNDFPIANLEIDVNGKPVGVVAKGFNAERTKALLMDAPENVLIEVFADTEYRESRDGRTFMDPVVTEAFLLGNVGDPIATFKVQGYVEGVKEIEKNNGGSFYLGLVRELKFAKDGQLPGAVMEVALDDGQVSEWRAAEGQFVFVRGSFSGWKSDKGRIWPRFNAEQANFLPTPSWLVEYGPSAPETSPAQAEEQAAVADAFADLDLSL